MPHPTPKPTRSDLLKRINALLSIAWDHPVTGVYGIQSKPRAYLETVAANVAVVAAWEQERRFIRQHVNRRDEVLFDYNGTAGSTEIDNLLAELRWIGIELSNLTPHIFDQCFFA